jgi:MFS superfamily sulfate permease-like transporter
MNNFKSKLFSLIEWINRRWILMTIILSIVFWVVSSNFLIGLMVAFFIVVFFMLIHALIKLSEYKKDNEQ